MEAAEATTINTAVIEYSVTEAALEELKAQYPPEAIPKDLSIKENYEHVRKGIAHVRGLRSDVEAHRKELKKDALEYGRKVDAAAKKINDKLMAIEAPMKEAKIDYDTEVEIRKREEARREEERIDRIATRIAGIRASVEANISSDSDRIREVMTAIEKENPEEWAEEFLDKTKTAVVEALEKLQELYAMKLESEKAAEAAAEAEKRRQEEEARARAEKEKELARIKEENAREAERLAAEKAALQKEREAIDAEKRRSVEEERLRREEKQRKAEAAKAAALAEKNEEKNIEEAIKALANCTTRQEAEVIVTAIRSNKIPHVVWTNI